MDVGAIVILNLREPTEKFWGVLERLDVVGVSLRGLSIESFDDWMSQAASGEAPSIAPTTMFVPMARVERIFLDEQVGVVESYCQRFEKRVGLSVSDYLGLAPEDLVDSDGEVPS